MADETEFKKGKPVPAGTDVPQDKVCQAEDLGEVTPADAEVVGHRSSGGAYMCFAGDWSGTVPAGWDYFICPNGHVNLV